MSATRADDVDPIAAHMAEHGAAILSHLNDDHDDTVLLVGRILTGRRRATRAELTGIDGAGVDLLVTDDGAPHAARVAFDEAVTDPAQLQPTLMALVARARALSGEPGMTSIEREAAELAGTRTFVTEVVAVEDVHDHLRRITLRGDDLATFAPIGPDTFLYLLLPPPGRRELTIGRDFAWSQVPDMPEEDRPVGAYYTLRAWRPEQRELDVLVVLHGDTGPASAWGARARPGDPVALWGPRTAFHPPAGTDSMLLVADETGLPAMAVILEQAGDLPVVAVAEVADEHAHLPLRTAPSIQVHWLHRDGAPAGTTTALADLVATLPLPGARPYVWGGGESRALTAIRRHVRQERGLDREAVSLVAYWRHTTGPEGAASS